MDQNQPVSNDFEKEKRKLNFLITDELLNAVKDKKIDLKNLRPTSYEVLLEVDKIQKSSDFIPVLEIISKKWNFLSGVLTKFKYENQSTNEKQVIDKLSSYIKNFN